MIDLNLTRNYVIALTGSPDTVIDWRCIHDQDKGVPAHTYRGTIDQMQETLIRYNDSGYGIFCNINAMDGQGHHLPNVEYIRAHVVDLDNPLTARASYDRTVTLYPTPTFAVQTSPEKFHVYWIVEPYVGNDFYTVQQRKLRQLFDGDKNVIDATRVLRVPGFYHRKNTPYLVTCWSISNQRCTHSQLETALKDINVFDNFTQRHPLGEKSMEAPSLDWLRFAMSKIDPNEMDRPQWMSYTAAIKQAGWNLTDETELRGLWDDWCARFENNDPGENNKLWNSLRDTELGWATLERIPAVKASIMFGHKDASTLFVPVVEQKIPEYIPEPEASVMPNKEAYGEILDPIDCQNWFKNCFFVAKAGEIFSASGRFMNSTKFNGLFGGKQFIITSTGKLTDEPWRAALRSTVYTIPKVDHIRFLPDRLPFETVNDELGRPGLNTYIPAKVQRIPGDISPFLNHLAILLPDKTDQKIILDYMAHVVKYPGYKIAWAPLIQSVQGAGKTIIGELLSAAIGTMYTYTPKAQELVKSGSVFNAWMRGKLMIIVDEIKVDERRELSEILKPMISEKRIEIQSKGVDQDMEDNPANWMFFSNWKDAIPIDDKDRRYSIFFSAIQTIGDLQIYGLDQTYYSTLVNWIRKGGGGAAVAHYLYNYPIEEGALPHRAPHTSSKAEAIRLSRSPMEIVINDCILDELPGFRGGFISVQAALQRSKASGLRNATASTVERCLKGMQYVELGRANHLIMQEDTVFRTVIFGKSSSMSVNDYVKAQGYA